MNIKAIAASLAALALLAGACSEDEPAVTNTGTDAPTQATEPGTESMTDPTDAGMTADDVQGTLGVPADVTIDSGEQLEDGTYVFAGTYTSDPMGAEASMVAAGWEHLMTRPGSYNMSFRIEGWCAAVRADTELRWGAAVAMAGASVDCDAWAVGYFGSLQSYLEN